MEITERELPAGRYTARITAASDIERDHGEQDVVITYEIAEGEFERESFDVWYIWTPASDGSRPGIARRGRKVLTSLAKIFGGAESNNWPGRVVDIFVERNGQYVNVWNVAANDSYVADVVERF